MLKLIIVDDERATREKLVGHIDWARLQIEVVGEAKDGIEGLELVNRIRPDIVLLDVRMPRMNGVACATEIRKYHSDCKIIFLSGFTDKEYLKTAIQIQAVDYIEKPIDLLELQAVLKRTSQICFEERNHKAKQAELLNRVEMNLLWIKQELALEMIRKHANFPSIRKKMYDANLPIPNHEYFLTIMLRLHLHRALGAGVEPSLRTEPSLDIVYREFDSVTIPCVAGFRDEKHVVIHIYGKHVEDVSSIKKAIKHIQIAHDAMFCKDGMVTAGIGKPVRGMENVSLSYQFAGDALERCFLEGSGGIIFYAEDIRPREQVNVHEIKARLELAFRDEDPASALCTIEDLARDLVERTDYSLIPKVKAVFLSVLLQHSSLAEEDGLAELLKYGTLAEVVAKISDKLQTLFDQMQEQKGKSKKVRSALTYIREHFGEDLSVAILADRLGMSPAYLSTLFKKETGLTLSDYIENTRMEKAKVLLQNDQLKMQEVAQSVGYRNANYFTTVFKKTFGMYPSDYRRNLK